ncbi:MAG TPA: PIN domain-containing protein [Chloroflexi bacterium]|nr:PIN domain-containing protein [Chloroflexota bacterium]
MPKPRRPRVFVDADVLFAGAASPTEHGASLVVLRMAEITLVEAFASEQVVAEAERNLENKLPQALPTFRLLVSRCLRVVPDPQPDDLKPHAGLAHPEDLPILVAALREGCRWLVTFNLRHYQPGHPDLTVLRPGEFVLRVRDLLAYLDAEEEE